MKTVDQLEPSFVDSDRRLLCSQLTLDLLTGDVVVTESIKGPSNDGRHDEEDDAAGRSHCAEVGDDVDRKLFDCQKKGGD